MDLPEVEAVRRWLQAEAVGRRARALRVAPGAAWREPLRTARLEGAHLLAVERVGRHLLLQLDAAVLGLAPRGHGHIRVGRSTPPGWRVALDLEPSTVWLCDRGATARAMLINSQDPRRADNALAPLDPQGVEPLSAAFTLGTFKKVLRGRKRNIFRLLVDGQLIAGIGGTYADEILYASRVRPTRPAPSLGDDELRSIYYATLEVLQKAIRFGGVSDEPYIEGQPGTFGRFLSVHARKGAPCPGCRARVRVVRVDATPAFFCPRCQC
jgi:formamidopyrimidine-DNA glycosylase